jgi:hypothetical protein
MHAGAIDFWSNLQLDNTVQSWLYAIVTLIAHPCHCQSERRFAEQACEVKLLVSHSYALWRARTVVPSIRNGLS